MESVKEEYWSFSQAKGTCYLFSIYSACLYQRKKSFIYLLSQMAPVEGMVAMFVSKAYENIYE